MSWYMYVMLLIKLLAVVYGIYNWSRLSPFLKLITTHSVAAFITELIGMCMSMLHYSSNAAVFNIFMPIELTVLSLSGLYFVTARSSKNIIVSIIAGGVIYWLYCVFAYSIHGLFNWYRLATSIAIVGMFTAILLNNTVFSNRKIFTQPVFLVGSTKVLYYAITIPLFSLYTYMVENNVSAIYKVFYISHVTDFIQYTAVIVAIYMYIRSPQNTETYIA